MTSIRDVDSRGRMAIVMSGRHSGDISVHDNSSLSEDEIYALAMQVKEWHHNDIDDVIADRKRIVSSLNGRVGSLDIELDWFNDDNFRSDPRKFFSVSVKNKSHVVGKVDSYDERFKSLYESVYESIMRKVMYKKDEREAREFDAKRDEELRKRDEELRKRDDGLREAKRILYR